MYNKVILIGRLTATPEMVKTASKGSRKLGMSCRFKEQLLPYKLVISLLTQIILC